MGSLAAKARAQLLDYEAQDLANTAWAFSKMENAHLPLLKAISAEAIRKLAQFATQNISNTAWAFSALALQDPPLFAAIASESMAKIAAFGAQAIANTSWSFARRSCRSHGPLFEALAAAARTSGNTPGAGGEHGYAI